MSESEPKVDTSQGEAISPGASSPTGEFVVIISAADIANATEAPTSTTSDLEESAYDLQNPGTEESAEEPIANSQSSKSATENANGKETSSAAKEEEKTTSELEYKYECKFLEERYIRDSNGSSSWQIIDAGTAPPPDPPAPDSSKYTNYPLCLITEWDLENKRLTDRKLQAKSKALKRVVRRCLEDRDPTWKIDEDDTMECSWPWEPWFRGLDCFKAEKARLEKLIEKNGGEADKSNKDWEEMTTCGVLIDTLETYHSSTIKAMKELIPRGYVNYEM